MIELLSMILGIVGRVVPHFVQLWQERREQDHEYRMTDLQLKIDAARAQHALDLVHANSAAAVASSEMQAWADAIASQGKPVGVPFVDGLSASVRPVLTYWHCLILYTAAKVAQGVVLWQDGHSLAQLVIELHSDFDKSLVGTMIGFWFADRALMKAKAS